MKMLDIADRICRELNTGGKALVIQTAFLGDVILITPLLRGIRHLFPKAKVTALIRPEFGVIVQDLVDEIFTIDKHDPGVTGELWQDMSKKVHAAGFAVAFIPHRSIRSARLAAKSGIPFRIGFNRGPGRYFYTHRVPYVAAEYEGSRNLGLLRVIKDAPMDEFPALNITSNDIESAKDILHCAGIDADSKFILIAPGSVWKTKRWPSRNYRELANKIETGLNWPVLAVGGGEDTGYCLETVSSPERNLAGKTTVLQTAAIMKRAEALISGDTAPAHIATAMRTRQAIIFGSTARRFGFAPSTNRCRTLGLDLWCRPCSDHGRRFCPRWGSYKCLGGISAEIVFSVLKELLRQEVTD